MTSLSVGRLATVVDGENTERAGILLTLVRDFFFVFFHSFLRRIARAILAIALFIYYAEWQIRTSSAQWLWRRWWWWWWWRWRQHQAQNISNGCETNKKKKKQKRRHWNTSFSCYSFTPLHSAPAHLLQLEWKKMPRAVVFFYIFSILALAIVFALTHTDTQWENTQEQLWKIRSTKKCYSFHWWRRRRRPRRGYGNWRWEMMMCIFVCLWLSEYSQSTMVRWQWKTCEIRYFLLESKLSVYVSYPPMKFCFVF